MRWRTPAVPVRPRLDQGQRARSRATMVVVVDVVAPGRFHIEGGTHFERWMKAGESNMLKPGSTLSQRGLAIRLNRSTSWVRRQGAIVKGFVQDLLTVVRPHKFRSRSHSETWGRMNYHDGRLHGYRLMTTGAPTLKPTVRAPRKPSPRLRKTMLCFPGDPDLELK
jgi:hypothetical protein